MPNATPLRSGRFNQRSRHLRSFPSIRVASCEHPVSARKKGDFPKMLYFSHLHQRHRPGTQLASSFVSRFISVLINEIARDRLCHTDLSST